MFNQSLHILLVEDNPGDIDLIQAILSESDYASFRFTVAIRMAQAMTCLATDSSIDIVLLDMFLPDSQGIESVCTLREAHPEAPIVVLTVLDNEENGMQAVKHGAQDYLIKDQIEATTLTRAIRYAIERNRLDMEARRQRDELARLAEERAQLLQLEKEARARAEEANQLKSKFLAMVSHELRTPLTSLKGFTSTLLSPDVSWKEEQRKEFIGVLKDETEKMVDLVEHLLDVSKMQAGIFALDLNPVSVPHIVEQTHAPLIALTQRHTLNIDVPESLPPVRADKMRISQVLLNLVGNASKYAPPSTRITLSATLALHDFVQVDVADEGPGIPPEMLPHLFEPFHKAGGYFLSTRDKGMGLGLTLCRGIVEAHTGKIWIAETSSPGTTVSFTLPIVF
jgi:signal transduction histidine kinase